MLLNVILNIVLCAIIVLGAIFGIKRGFISMAARPVKLALSLMIAFSACAVFAEAVVYPIIEAPISNYVKDFLYANCEGLTASNVNEELPTLLKIAASIFGINVNEVANNAQDAGAAVLDAIVDNLTSPVISVIAEIISFVVLYFVAKLVLSLVLWFVNAIFKSGVFGLLNKTLGIIFGTATAIILAWALVAVLEFVVHSTALQSVEMIAEFEGAFLYKFFSTYNPIELLLSF